MHAAIIIDNEDRHNRIQEFPEKIFLRTDHPKLTFFDLVPLFYPQQEKGSEGVHQTLPLSIRPPKSVERHQ
jgi:hypothetical protein